MKKSLPFALLIFLLLLGAQTILSFGTPLAWLIGISIHEILAYAVLLLFETAGLLILLMILGAAFGAVHEGSFGRATVLLVSAVGAHFFGMILSLFWMALFFRQGITGETLALLLGGVLDSSVIPLFAVFFISYFVYLRKAPHEEPQSYRDTASSPVKSAILSTVILFAYRLLGQILEAVEFVQENGALFFLNFQEKLFMVLDFIPVFAVSIGGYYLMLLARRLYLKTSAAWQTEKEPVHTNNVQNAD